MINVFNIKKKVALLLCSLLAAIAFYIGMVSTKSILYAMIYFFVAVIISQVLGHLLLKNPFNQMLEGKGILALNLDSTGLITPFIVAVKQPYMYAKLGKNWVRDIFDRNAVYNITTPKKNKTAAEVSSGVKLELNEEEYNKARFALFHYPCLLYNKNIGSFLTKDFLSDKESGAFAQHQVLFLNRQLEELTSKIRDFGRYIVENLKPAKAIFQSPITWVIIAVVVVILIILFAPALIQNLSGTFGSAGGAFSKASGAVQPR